MRIFSPVLTFAWAFAAAGDSSLILVDDIQRRVVSAGGNVDGVLVASLSWSTSDDLDLHVVTPKGGEINYQRKQAAGGTLDVDMCVGGKHSGVCTERPVENVVFTDAAEQGRYEVYVQNFNYHLNVRSKEMQVADVLEGRKPSKENKALRMGKERPVLFELLMKVEGKHYVFSGLCTPAGKTHSASNVKVFTFEYFPNALTEEARLVPILEATGAPECEEFRQKLLGPGARHSQDYLEGSGPRSALPNSGKNSVSHTGRGDVRPSRTGSAGARASPTKGKKHSSQTRKSSSRASEDRKFAALQAIRASSRSALLSQSAKALRELLSDLGEFCRGCLDKSEYVDKLRKIAGVEDEREEL